MDFVSWYGIIVQRHTIISIFKVYFFVMRFIVKKITHISNANIKMKKTKFKIIKNKT